MNIFISPVGSLHVTGGTFGDVINLGPASQVDVVDVSSGETSRGPPMRHSRFFHAAAASPTSLFVLGGDATDKSVEVFNPHTRQ